MAKKRDYSKLKDFCRLSDEFGPSTRRHMHPLERTRLRFLAYMAAPKEQNEKTQERH
jgi:hypothetical protein